MKAAIMQPYFLPYVGYFQLIESVDLFIVYDNIKYTKKGWINRNRMLQNGHDVVFSLPLKRDSDSLDVRDREIAVDFRPDKLLNQIAGAYRRAPYFVQTFPLIEQIVRFEERNLFRYLHHSIVEICEHLGRRRPWPEGSGPGAFTLRGGGRRRLRERDRGRRALFKGGISPPGHLPQVPQV
jgi:hypothetical protein